MPKYNEIETTEHANTLWKNFDHKPIGKIPFKNILIEWGLGPDKKVRIRRIVYPKENYNIMDVMKIAEETRNCPFCVKGKDMSEPLDKGFDKYLNSRHTLKRSRGPMSIENTFNKVSSTVENAATKVFGGATSNVLPQIIAKGPQYITGYVSSTLGRKIIDGLIGIGGLVALQKGKLAGLKGDSAEIFFGNFISNIFNTNGGAMFEMNNDIAKLKNAVSFGDSKGVFDAFLNNENLAKIGAGNLPSFKLPNLNFGGLGLKLRGKTFGKNLLLPSKATSNPNTQQMDMSGPSFGIPMQFNGI